MDACVWFILGFFILISRCKTDDVLTDGLRSELKPVSIIGRPDFLHPVLKNEFCIFKKKDFISRTLSISGTCLDSIRPGEINTKCSVVCAYIKSASGPEYPICELDVVSGIPYFIVTTVCDEPPACTILNAMEVYVLPNSRTSEAGDEKMARVDRVLGYECVPGTIGFITADATDNYQCHGGCALIPCPEYAIHVFNKRENTNVCYCSPRATGSLQLLPIVNPNYHRFYHNAFYNLIISSNSSSDNANIDGSTFVDEVQVPGLDTTLLYYEGTCMQLNSVLNDDFCANGKLGVDMDRLGDQNYAENIVYYNAQGDLLIRGVCICTYQNTSIDYNLTKQYFPQTCPGLKCPETREKNPATEICDCPRGFKHDGPTACERVRCDESIANTNYINDYDCRCKKDFRGTIQWNPAINNWVGFCTSNLVKSSNRDSPDSSNVQGSMQCYDDLHNPNVLSPFLYAKEVLIYEYNNEKVHFIGDRLSIFDHDIGDGKKTFSHTTSENTKRRLTKKHNKNLIESEGIEKCLCAEGTVGEYQWVYHPINMQHLDNYYGWCRQSCSAFLLDKKNDMCGLFYAKNYLNFNTVQQSPAYATRNDLTEALSKGVKVSISSNFSLLYGHELTVIDLPTSNMITNVEYSTARLGIGAYCESDPCLWEECCWTSNLKNSNLQVIIANIPCSSFKVSKNTEIYTMAEFIHESMATFFPHMHIMIDVNACKTVPPLSDTSIAKEIIAINFRIIRSSASNMYDMPAGVGPTDYILNDDPRITNNLDQFRFNMFYFLTEKLRLTISLEDISPVKATPNIREIKQPSWWR